MVSLAALTLLTDAAEKQPVVCVIDDAQWMDRDSAQTLSFIARRLMVERLVMVFALRDLTDRPDLTGLTTLHIGGLTHEEARQLLDSVFTGPVDARARHQLLQQTQGNPLALLELTRHLSGTEWAFGVTKDATRTSLSTRIERAFLARLRDLPERTQKLLLVAAVEPSGDGRLVWQSAERLGIDVAAAAAPAFEAGLLEENGAVGAEVRLRHPLVRSSVVRHARVGDVREVHAALADVTDAGSDPDRRAWHRGQAAVGLDDDVATELEASAQRAQARGGLAAAARSSSVPPSSRPTPYCAPGAPSRPPSTRTKPAIPRRQRPSW